MDTKTLQAAHDWLAAGGKFAEGLKLFKKLEPKQTAEMTFFDQNPTAKKTDFAYGLLVQNVQRALRIANFQPEAAGAKKAVPEKLITTAADEEEVEESEEGTSEKKKQ